MYFDLYLYQSILLIYIYIIYIYIYTYILCYYVIIYKTRKTPFQRYQLLKFLKMAKTFLCEICPTSFRRVLLVYVWRKKLCNSISCCCFLCLCVTQKTLHLQFFSSSSPSCQCFTRISKWFLCIFHRLLPRICVTRISLL